MHESHDMGQEAQAADRGREFLFIPGFLITYM